MCSGCPESDARSGRSSGERITGAALLFAFLSGLPVAAAMANPARELRVCADPNNLPFSNDREEGFENRIVDIVARELGASVSYVWWAQRRGYVRNTLKAGLCDRVPGTPSGLEPLRTTRPYYRSTYVFVTRADGPQIASFDDPALRGLRIGVQLIGDDGANTPPVAALARRGIAGRVHGFPVYGDYSMPNPSARIVDAVASGDVDVAIVWGPLAGYFADRQGAKLRISPVMPAVDLPMLPMVYDISMGVRREDVALRGEIDEALTKHRAEIEAVLSQYHVPRPEQGQTVPR